MLFHEPLFLFLAGPVFFAIYYLFTRWQAGRFGVLLLGSILFYLWGEPRFVPVVLISAFIDYTIGKALPPFLPSRHRKSLLTLGIAANLGLLGYFKYLNFVAANLDPLLVRFGFPSHLGPIALPIGVSFIVFEKISYLADLYRGRSAPAASFAHYLGYVFFFPKLLAGPILKFHEMTDQLRRMARPTLTDFTHGFMRFMLGVVRKTLLADTLSTGADKVFAAPGQVGFGDAWTGVLLFTLQIYFDFSSYSDMAIGLARMMGFSLKENFDRPYISRSVTEFWRRWHISLTTWIREYLYIPLGGNRASPTRLYLNLWLCFLASGLWHGAAWTYVLWGVYNGVFLVLERLFLRNWLARLPAVLATGCTFMITMVGWTTFRASSLGQAGQFYRAMLRPGQTSAAPIFYGPDVRAAAIIGLAICLIPALPEFNRVAVLLLAPARRATTFRFLTETAVTLLFLVALTKALADPFKPFLYFRF